MSAALASSDDADRTAIRAMLVDRDIAAFVAGDWSAVAKDFDAEAFLGLRGAVHPDDWRIGFPTLDTYRDEWLHQAQAFAAVRFVGEDGSALLHRATRLDEIEIAGNRALAHKKFKAVARLQDGGDYSLDWQTLYLLRRRDGVWAITGFAGYLPHPFPASTAGEAGAPVERPHAASQHVTAGPYSPSLRVRPGVLVAISGQGPIDGSGAIVGRSVADQTRLTLDNCAMRLAEAGARFADVFQVRVFLASMEDWAEFNAVYTEYMRAPFPVRTAVECRLWGNILVEVDMTANVVG